MKMSYLYKSTYVDFADRLPNMLSLFCGSRFSFVTDLLTRGQDILSQDLPETDTYS